MKKLIGYQVYDPQSGEHWNDTPSFEILSENEAINDVTEAREMGKFQFLMIGIFDGDVEEPILSPYLLFKESHNA